MSENVPLKRRSRGSESVREERKRLKTSGQEYMNYKMVPIPAKKPPSQNVECKCKFSCKILSYDHKLQLFHQFYKCDKSTQGTYLMGLIQIGAISRRRHGQYEQPENSRRQATMYYTVPNGDGEHVRICRQTFSQIFALSHKQVQVLVEKKKGGSINYDDKRGKHTKERKYDEQIRNQIRAHIKSFPVEENHYSRKKSNKQFLSPDLNINRMYRAFKEKHHNTIVTYRYYSDIFHKEFQHLRFGRPRSDTCSSCDLYNNTLKSNPKNKTTQMKQELHHRKAQAAIDCLKDDTVASQVINSNQCTVSMDLQQVIFIPTLTHSHMFYSRQLSVYNLCIHIANSNEAIMSIWDETIGGRGGNEIASCLLNIVLDGHLGQFGRKLILWTDNCIGQNKNRMILLACIFLIINDMFDEIEQKFLVSGHSYMPCDRDFALIEKRKRVEKCFTPKCVEEMIKTTRHITPFRTISMKSTDFKNVQAAADVYLNTSKLNISQASILKITKDNPATIKIKKTFSKVEEWQEVNVLKKGKTIEQLASLQLTDQISRSRITKEKLKNLQDMIPYIPSQHQPFYKKLIENQQQESQTSRNSGT